jgi:Rieske Fe-S protein
VKLFSRGPVEPLWREEFPIDAASERYVTRRQFAKFLVLGSAGMVAGQFWILAKGSRHARLSFPPVVVARVGEIPVGGVKLFAYPTPDDPCILLRLSDDEYVAYDQKCTHLSCAVYYDRASGEIHCPCHEGRFAAQTGSVIAGPPPRALPRIVLERRGDDLVATGVDLQAGA